MLSNMKSIFKYKNISRNLIYNNKKFIGTSKNLNNI